jgi:DNA polymerase-1
MRTNFKIIKSRTELDELISYCQETSIASIDFETNSTNVSDLHFIPTILGVSFQCGSGWIIPLAHKDSPFKSRWKSILKKFGREVVEHPGIDKYFYNAMFEYRIFLHYDILPKGRIFDPMLMKYLLWEERPNDLKSMVDSLLPEFAGYDLEGKPGKKAKPEAIRDFWENVPLRKLSKYCAGDADFTLRLGLHWERLLIEKGFNKLFRNMYMPLVRILAKTVYNGVMVDREYLKTQLVKYKEDLDSKLAEIMDLDIVYEFNEDFKQGKTDAYIEDLEDEIESGTLSPRSEQNREDKISRIEAGDPQTKKEIALFEDINLNSATQLRELLYTHDSGFNFPVINRTDGGEPSTAEDTLLELMTEYDEPFIQMLLDYRALSKMYTTYIYNIYHEKLTHNDKIHPSYLLHGTVTNRLSSRGPNFQNIPRATTAAPIKKMFHAPPEHFFVEVDYSQAELRYAAEVSGDKAMLEIFNSGKNIHVGTASRVFGIDYDTIQLARKDELHPDHLDMIKKHKAAKVLNFTIFYGAGDQKVAEFITQRTGDRHTKEDARRFINQWFEAFPECEKWIKKQHRFAKKHGYVQSIFGIRRRLPIFLNPSNEKTQKGAWNTALRQSVNAEIQGASSNLTQWFNIAVHLEILRGNLPSYMHLVSTVHDSIEFYVHKNDAHWVFPRLIQVAKELPEMEKYLGVGLKRVPMKASLEYGINWGVMHEFTGREEDFPKIYNDEIKNYILDN